MPYITIGSTGQLQIQVPTPATTDWADTLKTQTFLKIAEHDHTGTGKGSQLGAGSILANAINGTKMRLSNDEYLRGRNQAGSADINVVKVTTSDKLQFGADIAVMDLVNNAYLRGRNNADNAYFNILKVLTTDQIEVNASLLKYKDSVVLTDNTAVAADASIITLVAGETAKVEYQMIRNSVLQKGELSLIYPSAISESYTGTDLGVTFSMDTGVLKYESTSTGNNATIKFIVIKE